MKQIYRFFLVIGIVLLIVGAIFFLRVYFLAREDYEQSVSAAHIVIYLEEDIPDLEHIEFSMCNHINIYDILSIKDTVSQNVDVSNDSSFCNVTVKYIFTNGSLKECHAENFNCKGCSGSNSYILSKDSVAYEYRP